MEDAAYRSQFALGVGHGALNRGSIGHVARIIGAEQTRLGETPEVGGNFVLGVISSRLGRRTE